MGTSPGTLCLILMAHRHWQEPELEKDMMASKGENLGHLTR